MKILIIQQIKHLHHQLLLLQYNEIVHYLNSINISLYFKVLPEYKPNVSATYFCSFYDTNNSRWNESGCTDTSIQCNI